MKGKGPDGDDYHDRRGLWLCRDCHRNDGLLSLAVRVTRIWCRGTTSACMISGNTSVRYRFSSICMSTVGVVAKEAHREAGRSVSE